MPDTPQTETEHRYGDIESIVVEADDVVEAMRRNRRDEDEQRSHVLRITPPFEGRVTATPHVSEAHTYYPPEMDPKPLHLGPDAFLVGHSDGARHPSFEDRWRVPRLSQIRSEFYDEYDLYDEDGERQVLTDEQETLYEEYMDTICQTWEDQVRHVLNQQESLTLDDGTPNFESITVGLEVIE